MKSMFLHLKKVVVLLLCAFVVASFTSLDAMKMFIPSGSSFFKMSDGEEAAVYTAMIVKEDDISLYGFDSKDDLVLFEFLITVSGIGAKGAMSIMSTLRADDLRRAIATGDAKTISKANGVGKKMAERLILELKDKIGSFEAVEEYTVLQDEIEASDEKTKAVPGRARPRRRAPGGRGPPGR